MSDEMKFDPSGLDIWTDEESFEVTRERIAEYAAATNDPIQAHRNGDVASPVFSVVPVFGSMTAPAFSVVPINLVGKIVHGEQDFVFHRAIKPGEKVLSKASMVGYKGQANGTSGHIVLETRGEDGELINEQHVTLFVRGFDAGETLGPEAPDHRFPESVRDTAPVAKVSQHVDDDQTFRYSPASGDPMPIHLDEEFAKEMGLPGIIAHGLCTMAFTSWAVLTEVGGSDTGRLKRLAVRFAKPVLPGQDLVTQIWKGESKDGVTTYHYETTVGEDVVIKDGLAEIAD